MKTCTLSRFVVILLSAVILSGVVSSAFAQTIELNALKWREVPVKNIHPSMLAYWIDPTNHEKPMEYQQADDYIRQSLSPKQKAAPAKAASMKSSSASELHLPAGVATIFADDTNKVILARATQEGFNQLEQIVEFLDRPIRKIDFDIKLIQLNSANAALLRSDLELKRSTEPNAQHGNLIVNKSIKSKIADLIKTGSAKVIKSTQLVLQNNLTDRYTTSTFTPVTVDIKLANNGDSIVTTQAEKDNPLFMEKRLSLVLTPTINNDDTITIFNNVSIHAQLTHQQSSADNNQLRIKTLDNQSGLITVCTLQNGGSMVLTGFDSGMLGIDNQNNPIVLLVKAEIEK